MTNVQPGWIPDPSDSSTLRWWDGQQWTTHVARNGVVGSEPLPAAKIGFFRRLPLWAWILIGVVAVILALVLSRIVAPIALAVLITGIVALSKGTPTWLRLTSKRAATIVTASAAAVFLVTGVVSASVPPAPPAEQASVEAVPFVGGNDGVTTATPKPSPTPTATTRDEKVTEPIVFEQTTVEDPAIARGQTQITTAGQNGEKTLTYRVKLVDGKEVSRELVSEVVTRQPIAQVTSVGTYDPPPPPPAPEASGCDSNYADACVPIASDVDCAWGTGDGPAYFDGVARVVGSDVYDLDRDNDGYACER